MASSMHNCAAFLVKIFKWKERKVSKNYSFPQRFLLQVFTSTLAIHANDENKMLSLRS